jgi:DNA-binding CsgD family transcriptional regulator
MRCRQCSSTNTRVTCTDHYGQLTKRYCRCLDCGHKYRTVEQYEVLKPGPPKGKPRPGKIARGSNHGMSIFTEKDIRTMRRMYELKGHTLQEIADKYGISKSYTSRIINRKKWAHVN